MGHKSPIQNSKNTRNTDARENSHKNVCKGFVKPPLFLMHCILPFL